MLSTIGIGTGAGGDLTDAAHLGSRTLPMIDTGIAFLAMAWIAVLLRIYVRAWMIRSFGWDDITIVITTILFTGICACVIAVGNFENSRKLHLDSEKGIIEVLPDIERLTEIVVVFIALYLWTTVFLKISLAIFFLRLIITPWQRKVVYISTAIYAFYAAGFAFLAVFECGNPAHFLMGEIEGKCISDSILQPMNYIATVINALTDWIFVIFPLYLVCKAQMPLVTKASVGTLLLMGVLGSIASLIRLQYIPEIKTGPHFFSHAVDIGIWSIIEPGIYIFAVCLATLRPFFSDLLELTRRSLGSESGGGLIGSNKWRSNPIPDIEIGPMREGKNALSTEASETTFIQQPQQTPSDPEKDSGYEEFRSHADSRVVENSRRSQTDQISLLADERRFSSPRSPPAALLPTDKARRSSRGHFYSFSQESRGHPDPPLYKARIKDGKVVVRQSSIPAFTEACT